MVVSLAVVRLHDAASASAFKSLVDLLGTGNVADLLREGRGYPRGAGLARERGLRVAPAGRLGGHRRDGAGRRVRVGRGRAASTRLARQTLALR